MGKGAVTSPKKRCKHFQDLLEGILLRRTISVMCLQISFSKDRHPVNFFKDSTNKNFKCYFDKKECTCMNLTVCTNARKNLEAGRGSR